MSKETENQNESIIPNVSEASNTLGDIRINHSVVASIVRLAALEVSGVAAVGGGFVDGIAEIFSQKGDERGVRATRLVPLPLSFEDEGTYSGGSSGSGAEAAAARNRASPGAG